MGLDPDPLINGCGCLKQWLKLLFHNTHPWNLHTARGWRPGVRLVRFHDAVILDIGFQASWMCGMHRGAWMCDKILWCRPWATLRPKLSTLSLCFHMRAVDWPLQKNGSWQFNIGKAWATMIRTLPKISVNEHTGRGGSAGRRRERQSESTGRSVALGPSGVPAGKDSQNSISQTLCFSKDKSTRPAQNSSQMKVGYRGKGCFSALSLVCRCGGFAKVQLTTFLAFMFSRAVSRSNHLVAAFGAMQLWYCKNHFGDFCF